VHKLYSELEQHKQYEICHFAFFTTPLQHSEDPHDHSVSTPPHPASVVFAAISFIWAALGPFIKAE
jgi:hypothetical protein